MKFPFIKYTKVWFAFSIILTVLGVGAMVRHKMDTGYFMNWGIDFKGGSLMEYQFENPEVIHAQDLKETLEKTLPASISQITSTDQGTFLVQARDLTEEELTQLSAAVKETHGAFELLRFTSIGPKIGSTLKQKALLAVVVAMIAIVLYIAYAFRHVPKRVSAWRFGVCALVALVHDVVTVMGLFALFGYEVDALFITALLTVMGFSVHDTIVVFDRIRENLKNQGRDDTFGDVADASLNQTLARSINTSLSTLFPLFALYFLGAPSLKVFIFALTSGIIIGTYSSIFIASPLLTIWQERRRIR